MDDKILFQLLEILKTKKVKGIRKDSETQITIRFSDNTDVQIQGGAVDYGEREYLNILISHPQDTKGLIVGEW